VSTQFQHPATAHEQPQHPALRTLFAEGTPSWERIERFLSDHAFPLIEPGAATFIWVGDANAVELLRWIHAGSDGRPLERIEGTPLWSLRIPVEDGGRFEYKLKIVQPHGEEWVLDPRNPARAGDPFGENSVCQTFGYERPGWSRPQGSPQGRIEPVEVHSDAFGERRHEQVYLPAGYTDDGAYPLVVIHDGADFMSYGDLSVSLDNLIAAGDIPPLVAALVQTGDRMDEYPRGRRHARYLATELLPVLAERFALSDVRPDRILLGASLGAVVSLSTAFRYPGVFGGLILQSGSFILDRDKLEQREHPVFHRIARLVDVFRRAPDLPDTRAFVSTGTLEELAEENRALATFLRERGVDVHFQSSWDGHHWHNWRDQLRDSLMWVMRPNDR